MKILVIEDDVRLAEVIRRGLAESGHIVDAEHDGITGEHAACAGAYDAIILDGMLPGKDGLDVARSLRSAGIGTPILMLTARDTAEEIVRGLDAGADDYVRKPFVFSELEARLRSITRRPPSIGSDILCVADVRLDLATRRVRRGDVDLELTARETAFLEYLMRNAGRLVTRAMIEDALWERDRESGSNVIEVYIRRLRTKLSPSGEPPLIETVRRSGYRFGEGNHDA
jgi:DNA-binding response OmpR family regulator